MYTVSQAARLVGVLPHTVRYYDGRGLLVGVARDEAGYRMFDEDALVWLRTVVLLRDAGVQLQEIEEYVSLSSNGAESAEKCRIILEGFRRILVEKVFEINETVVALDRMIELCAWNARAAKLQSPHQELRSV